jgi:hypothetical protein
MALQRAGAPAISAVPGLPSVASAGPALSTRETTDRRFIELGVMFGQALGGREPVMQALTNLQNIGAEHGCDAIIAVRLLHYPTSAGPAVVAYGTGVRFLPSGDETPEAEVAAPPAVAAAGAAAGAADGVTPT